MLNLNRGKKGQTSGLVTGLIFGIAFLVIGVIIAFIITSTLSNSNLLTASRTSATTTNESDLSQAPLAFVNQTGYTLVNYNSITTAGVSITNIYADANQSNGTQSGILKLPSGYSLLVPSGNYTVSSVGVVNNATNFVYPNASITYVITTFSNEEKATTNLGGNLTSGVNNVSAKVPTVLLIAAIILILGVLGVLVVGWQRMRAGSGSI